MKQNLVNDNKEVSVGNIRWVAFLKNGKAIVENHEHGRTWRKVYKDNFKNIENLCFQLIPEGTKIFVPKSPFDEYWTFEDMETKFGGSTLHKARNICSLQKSNLDGSTEWFIVTIDQNKQVFKKIMSGKEIGYSTL